MDLRALTEVAALLGAVVGLGVLIKGLIEYTHQGRQRRADQFLELRRRFRDNEAMRRLCDLLADNSTKIRDVPFDDRRYYLALLEEVALIMNSHLIRPEVAHYFFGAFAISCWNSRTFWCDMNREDPYWALFRDFVAQMEKLRETYEYNRRTMRL